MKLWKFKQQKEAINEKNLKFCDRVLQIESIHLDNTFENDKPVYKKQSPKQNEVLQPRF